MGLLELDTKSALWLLNYFTYDLSPSRLSMTFRFLPFASLRSGSIGRCLFRVNEKDDGGHVFALAINASDAVTFCIFDGPIGLDLEVEEDSCNSVFIYDESAQMR